MNNPAVSIVLPTHNGSRYLAGSIQSCLDQTYTDFELVIVDDCSTDATPAIIAEYAARDPRIRTTRNERNRRLPGTLNVGFSMTRGRYLTWTSDDNLYLPDAISEMVVALEADPDVGLVYAPLTFIDAKGQEIGPGCFGGPPNELAFSCPVGACFLYQREVYQAVGDYAEDLFLVEDWDYWCRIGGKFRLRALPHSLYLFRLHDESLSRQRQANRRLAMRKLLERRLPEMDWVPRRDRAHGYLCAARYAWEVGDRRDALRHMLRAFGYSPTYTLRRFAEEPFDRMLKRKEHKIIRPLQSEAAKRYAPEI